MAEVTGTLDEIAKGSLDHVMIHVTDLEKSKAFYLAALAPLGYGKIVEMPGAVGLGASGKPDFFLKAGEEATKNFHVAFTGSSDSQVDAFYKAALAAGGKDNGPPGKRPHYHPGYYAAFVVDPDGLNIEVVHHASM